MEHLTKNTYNEKLILTLREISNNTEKEIKNKLDSYVNKIIGIGVAIFTASVAGIIVNVYNANGWPWWVLGIVLVIFAFLIFLVLKTVWFDNETVSDEPEVEIVKKFNTEIIQKVAEVNEAVSVARDTNVIECKLLNIMVSIYNINDMLNWLEENVQNKKEKTLCIRRLSDNISSKICSKKINLYALSIISHTLQSIDEKMKKMLETFVLPELEGYDLMQEDYKDLSVKIQKFNDFVKKSV